jgi:hypothetical protein
VSAERDRRRHAHNYSVLARRCAEERRFDEACNGQEALDCFSGGLRNPPFH